MKLSLVRLLLFNLCSLGIIYIINFYYFHISSVLYPFLFEFELLVFIILNFLVFVNIKIASDEKFYFYLIILIVLYMAYISQTICFIQYSTTLTYSHMYYLHYQILIFNYLFYQFYQFY